MIHSLLIFWWLLVAHAICDYPLQGDFLARGKNHKNPIPGIPWWQCLLAHSLIHGGAVAALTGNPVLGIFELGAHFGIDYLKSEGKTSFNLDQALHVFCKGLWVALIWVK
jgi:hypothetical protein